MLSRSKSSSPASPASANRRLRMLVVNTGPQLPLEFPDSSSGDVAITRKRLAQVPSPDADRYGLIVAEAPAEWDRDGHRLRRLIEAKPKSYVIIAPAPLLQQTAAEIQALGRALSAAQAQTSAHQAAPLVQNTDGEFLDGFMQKKLRTFVRAFSSSGGRDLYGFFMKEVERPLILFALEETHGNQRRAAELLGVNRNTLRKRIQDCRIQVKAKKTARPRLG